MSQKPLKIVLVGNATAGKTCFLNRLVDDVYRQDIVPTIAVDFRCLTLDGSPPIKLQLWDTAGQERYQAITPLYYRGVDGILLFYDSTDPSSFEALTSFWLKDIQNNAKPDTKVGIVGTKFDDPGSTDKCPEGYKCSAMKDSKDDLIRKIMDPFAKSIIDSREDLRIVDESKETKLARPRPKTNKVRLAPEPKKKSGGCC